MTPRRRAGAALIAAGVIASCACTSVNKQRADHARIAFGACPATVLQQVTLPEERRTRLKYSCGTLAVPLDHAAPSGATINVHVIRVRSTEQRDRLGSLIMNPGGRPGQSGLEYMAFWPGALSDDVLARFDIVSFDPRGTGRSAGIRCPEDDPVPAPDPDLLTASGYVAAAARGKAFDRECAGRLGPAAPYFNTEATARDMEAIRAALGDTKLTYLGYSYGAKLGGAYAHLYPQRVRALVLDAPSDPVADMITVQERQVAGFESAFGEYVASCGTRPTCRALGDPRAVLGELVERAADEPIPTGKPGDDRAAYAGDILRGVATFLYDDADWIYLDQALDEASRFDATMFFEVVDTVTSGKDDPRVADPDQAAYVINCNDRESGPSEERIRTAVRRIIDRNPVFGNWGAASLFACAYWQPARHPLGPPSAPTAAPVLVIGTVHDPATPYAGAVSFARALGSGRLLTWEGEGHTAYLRSDCITRIVDAYLIATTLPAANMRCRS